METTELPTLTVFEKPSLQDQVVAAAVGAVATIVATVVVTAGAELLSKSIANRKAKKLAKNQTTSPEED